MLPEEIVPGNGALSSFCKVVEEGHLLELKNPAQFRLGFDFSFRSPLFARGFVVSGYLIISTFWVSPFPAILIRLAGSEKIAFFYL